MFGAWDPHVSCFRLVELASSEVNGSQHMSNSNWLEEQPSMYKIVQRSGIIQEQWEQWDGTCPECYWLLWPFTGFHNASVTGIFLGWAGRRHAAIRPVGMVLRPAKGWGEVTPFFIGWLEGIAPKISDLIIIDSWIIMWGWVKTLYPQWTPK